MTVDLTSPKFGQAAAAAAQARANAPVSTTNPNAGRRGFDQNGNPLPKTKGWLNFGDHLKDKNGNTVLDADGEPIFVQWAGMPITSLKETSGMGAIASAQRKAVKDLNALIEELAIGETDEITIVLQVRRAPLDEEMAQADAQNDRPAFVTKKQRAAMEQHRQLAAAE